MKYTNDREAMEALRSKDSEGGFGYLQKKYYSKIRRYIFKMAHNAEDAEDIAQETFMKIYKSRKRIKNSDSPRSWIYKIARNTFISAYRKRKKFPEMLPLDEPEARSYLESARITNDKEAAFSWELEDLMTTAKELLKDRPERWLETFVLRERNGLKYEEIAETMKAPMGTVMSILYRVGEIMESKKSMANEIYYGQ